jgi:hypothetical protein
MVTDEEIQTMLGNTPLKKRAVLEESFDQDKRQMDFMAENYDGVVLTVHDDEDIVLRQVADEARGYNLAAEGFNTYGQYNRGNRIQLPYLWVTGFSDGRLVLPVYDALDQMFDGVYNTFEEAMKAVSEDIKITFPPAMTGVPPRTVCYHAQDLRLAGQTPGARLVGEIDAAKKSGRFGKLNFISPWSSLAAARGTNPRNIDEFVDAEQIVVLQLPKEYDTHKESYAPGLIKGVIRGLCGKLPMINRTSYRGPITLYHPS